MDRGIPKLSGHRLNRELALSRPCIYRPSVGPLCLRCLQRSGSLTSCLSNDRSITGSHLQADSRKFYLLHPHLPSNNVFAHPFFHNPRSSHFLLYVCMDCMDNVTCFHMVVMERGNSGVRSIADRHGPGINNIKRLNHRISVGRLNCKHCMITIQLNSSFVHTMTWNHAAHLLVCI